jgi:hypothetical protein
MGAVGATSLQTVGSKVAAVVSAWISPIYLQRIDVELWDWIRELAQDCIL